MLFSASYIIKGRSPGIKAKLAAVPPGGVAVSAVTQAELLYDLKSLSRSHWLHVVVHEFLKIVAVLARRSSAADYYAEIRYQLTISGQPFGEMAMMIAAHALDIDAVLVTNNTRHFTRIDAPLMLENWCQP